MSDAKMSDEKITIGIEVDHISVDRDNLVKEVEQIESDLGQNAGLFENMVPEVSNLFNPLVQSLRAGVDDVSKKLNEAMSGEKIGEDIVSGLNASVGAVTASLANMKAAASEVGQAFKAIPAGMEADFSKSINDMVRTAQSTLSKTYGMGGASRSVSGYATTLKNDKVFGASFDKTMQKYGLNETQSTELLNGIVRRVVPAMRNADISDSAIAASHGAMKRADFVPTITSFKERLPARYRDLPLDLTQTPNIPKKKASMYEGNLTHEEYNKVKMVAENNEVFERALQRAGVARRGTAMDGNIKKAGVLQMPKEPISRRQYAEALGYLYSEELIPSLEGAPAYYHPITSHKATDTRAIAAKNSSVPAAVYSATAQLDTIDVDPLLMPRGSKADIDAEAFKKGTVALTANAARVRPNMYQVMSLSYDDFAEGKVIDSKGETQSQFDDTATGRSVNKIIYQSGFTDLIGMHGNLSNGEGGKLNTSSPIMLQVDMSDRIRKKDSAGNLVFENGMPVMDDEGRALISNMFKKTKQMTYMRNGKEEVYNYAAVPYGKDGKNYVPTNVKDGKIVMVREEDYLAASRPWLEQLGVNVFDAFEGEDAEYADLSKFSKAFDVRNRNTTPSVPFEQVGGRMPASSKIGFVDASVVKGLMNQNEDDEDKDKKYALDGAFFAMPGYIPGGAGVVRAPGIKGAGVSVDFKQMIRDIYGDVDEFLLPGVNAPQEIKDEYTQNGLEGVRKKFSSEDISKYFVDAMQTEMLMTDSVLKSSIYTSGKTQQEMQKTFDTIMTLSGGMRIHKTANDFWSTQNSLSAQVSEKLDLSPEELQENADKWTGYINRLEHDPMFAVSELFSGENDPLSARIRENPALLNQDPEAQLRLQNAIDNAKNSMLYNEMFAKGDAAMGLALPNPGEFFTRAAQMNGMSIVDTTRYDNLALGDSKIAVPRLYDSVKLGGLRYPNNQGEQQSLENSREYIKLMDRYGLNRDAVYMNSKTIGKMGGGDFDGDTVQLIQGKLAKIIERTYANRGNLMENQKREREDLEKEPEALNRKATSDDVADFLYRQSTASFQMGAVSNANEALSQVDWSNPEHVARYAPGAKDLEIMYDIDSTFQKKGTLADWTAEANEARKLGRPFATLFKGLQGIADNPTPESFKQLGDFSKVNFASKYNGLTASMMTASASNSLSSGAVDMIIEAQSDLQGIPALKESGVGYKQKQAEFLELNNRVMAETLTRGAIPSTETIEKMKSALTEWGAALGSKKDGFEGWQTRKPEAMDDEQKAAVNAFRRQQGRIRFLGNMGLNQRSVEGKEGYAAVGFYKDNRLDTDISSFQSAFDEQKDAQRARLAITLGANKDSLKATNAAGERAAEKMEMAAMEMAAITAAKKRLSEMSFSYSSLNSFVETPERWYETYVAHPKENRPEYRTPETMLGSLTHKVQEIWVNDRLAAGGIGGARTADEYETIFRELLSGGDANTLKTKYGLTDKDLGEFAQLKDEIGYDPQTGEYNQKKIKGDFAKRFQNSIDYVRELPHMLKDWKIEGAEVVTSPDFGEGGQSNYGKIDLLAREPKTGKLVAFDTKASQTAQQIDKAKEQVMLYNAKGGKFVPETVTNGRKTAAHFEYGPDRANEARPFERGGVISYNIPATGNPEDRIKMFDIDEQKNADLENEYQERKAQVIRYAERGFNRNEIKNHTYRMSVPGASPAEEVQQPVSAQPMTAASAPQQMKVEIDPHSGRAVAQEITLQQGIDSYLEKMTGTQSQLLSMGRRKENPHVPNQWLNYDYMLNAGYDKQMEKLNAMGLAVDDPRRVELVKARDDAKAEFDRTLAISSLKDIESANEMLQDHFSKGEVDSSAAGFAKEYDSLTESVAKATQALELYKQQTEEIEIINEANKGKLESVKNGTSGYLNEINDRTALLTELLKKIESGKYSGEELQNLKDEFDKVKAERTSFGDKQEEIRSSLEGKINTAEADLAVRKENIQKADAANDELNKTLDEKKAYVSKKAETYFEKQLRDLQVKTTGESLTPEEIAAGKKDELTNRIESIKKGLAENVKKGVLTQDTATNLLNSIDAIDADAYGTKIQEGEQFKKEQEQASYQYKQEELARKRNATIAEMTERNKARRNGTDVDKYAASNRNFAAQIAQQTELARQQEDRAKDPLATEDDKKRSKDEAAATRSYIEKLKEAHRDTLRTDAVADIRDLNTKLAKQMEARETDSVAVGYAKQFDQLTQSVNEATAAYEELKKVASKDPSDQKTQASLEEAKAERATLTKAVRKEKAYLRKSAMSHFEEQANDIQHIAGTKEISTDEIADKKVADLKRRIDEYKKGIELDREKGIISDKAAEQLTKDIENVDISAYKRKMRKKEKFDRDQQLSEYAYSQEDLERRRASTIANMTERNEARRNGTSVDRYAAANRDFEAQLAQQRELMRKQTARANDPAASATERSKAHTEAIRTKDYISKLRKANEETLRVDAVADIRDLNKELTERAQTRDADSVAVSYAKEFDQLSESVKKAKTAYEELKRVTEKSPSNKKNQEALSEAEAEKTKLERMVEEERAYLQKSAKSHFENQFSDMRRMATGGEMSSEELATRKSDELARQIEAYKKGIKLDQEKGILSEDIAKRLLGNVDSIDVSAYKSRVFDQDKFRKDQEQKEYKYKQEELARKREDEILTARERNEARMEGKPVDKRKQEERAYNARMAELEEQRRRLSDLSMSTSGASDEERRRAATESGNLGKYIRDVQNVHDETLRTNAFADIRDLNTKLTEENKTRGVSREALEYAQQYKTLSESIEEATASYDELKKKIESGNYTKADADAETKARAQLEELQKNANAKREDLDKRVEESSSTRLDDLQRMALGKELTPADIAKMRKESLKKQIDQYVTDQRLIAGDENVGSATRSIAEIRATKAEKIDLDAYEQRILEQEELEREQRERQEQLRNERVKRNAEKQRKDPLGVRRNTWWGQVRETRDNARYQLEDSKAQLEAIAAQQRTKLSQTEVGTEEYKKLDAALKETESQIEETGAAAEKLDGPFGMAAAAAGKLAQSASNIALSLGKRVLSAALNEAKRFVVEWNASMTEIQMITGKTNQQISELSANLASKAVEMRVSTTEVSSAAADLYRQGLGDEDVAVRLEDVIKFSKVANIGTEEASKILTTAMSNGLVETTEEAMDAMVALGDSAATTASDIAKGMQKSAAAAKEAKVSYSELLTMLTIITSKTQLSGSEAGTTLNTLFNRMYRVSSGEDFYDENGNRIAATDTTRALQSVGVNMFDENGNTRGAYDILMDLATGWEGYDDFERNLILDTLGAGRQSSKVATLLQGLGEDDGELASKYMNLAENSDGVTDEKYQAYYENLAAAMENVKSSFDQLVETFDFDDLAIGFLNFIAECIQAVTALGEATDNVVPVLLTLVGVIAGAAFGPLGAILGGVLGFGASALIGSFIPEEQKTVDGIGNMQSQSNTIVSQKTETDAFLDRLDELNNKGLSRTKEETEELERGLAKLQTQFGITAPVVDGTTESFDAVAAAIKNAREEAAKLSVQELRFNLISNMSDVYNQASGELIDTNDNNSNEMHKRIAKIASAANGATPEELSEFIFSTGDIDYSKAMEYFVEDGEMQGILDSFGLSYAGYGTASGIISFLNDTDGARAQWADTPIAQAAVASMTDENGNLRFYNSETGEVDMNAAASVVMGELYIRMNELFGGFDEYGNTQNAATWEKYIKDMVISSAAGNTEVTNEQLSEYAGIFARNAVSNIMTAGDPAAQAEAALGVFRSIPDAIFDPTSESGYTDFLGYIENNKPTWNYKRPNGDIRSGLTRTEATNYAGIDYGTMWTVGNETFETSTAARNYLGNKIGAAYGEMTEADKNEVALPTFEEFLNGYNPDLTKYAGNYSGLWNSLKYKNFFGTPTESDEQLYKRLSNNENRETYEKEFYKKLNELVLYQYAGELFDSQTIFGATNAKLIEAGSLQVDKTTNTNVPQATNTSIVFETPVTGEDSADSTPTDNRMNTLIGNVGKNRLTYETSNIDKSEANEVFENITSAGITSLEELGKAIENGLIDSLDNVAKKIPGVNQALERAFEIDENGNWKVREGAGEAELANLIALIAGGSLDYTSFGTMSQADKLLNRRELINGALNGSEIDADTSSALTTALGTDLGLKILTASKHATIKDQTTWLEENAGKTENDYNNYVEATRRAAVSEALSPAEKRYVQTLTSNALYGVDGLLDSQKIGYRQQFANVLMNGGVSSLDESMRSVYTNGDSSSETLWAVSAALAANNLDFSALDLKEGEEGYEKVQEILQELGTTSSKVKKDFDSLNKTISTDSIKAANLYGKATDKVTSKMEALASADYADQIKTFNSALQTASNNKYYRDQWWGGNTKDEIKTQIASQLGVDTSMVDQMSSEVINEALRAVESQDMDNLVAELEAQMNSLLADEEIALILPDIIANYGGDMSGLIASLDALNSDAANIIIQSILALQTLSGSVTFGMITEGNTVGVRVTDIKMPKGVKSGKGGGGGGGGGKSAGKKLIEEQDHETTLREHIIKMIQYEETRYQNADELTNYGIMLQHEIDEEERQTKVIEKNIEALKNQLAQTSKGSDDWYELREAILKAEESLSEMNNTIDENKKKLKENEQAILKLHTDLEQEVKGEIETRIQEERDMLDGQVSMEQTILDAIKNRYEKEWELMQKDIDKKKKALQEEMDLIDERLQRRKDAEDEAEKYEELAEYKRQLALISTDSTRTKDQAALKEKIADLEKELAWDKAEEEADLQKEGIQDQIDAYDQYTEDYQEYLDDLLENANNFADEVNSVMQMSHEDMIAWLQKNVEEYTNSLESSQKQMTQGWDDTFKQMKGIIDTFWAEIAQTLSSKYNFLAYMHNSSAYQNASEDEKKQMDYNWGTMYDSWISAKKESEEAKNYNHDDDNLDGDGGGNSGDKKDTLRFGFKASYNGEPKQSRKEYLTTTEAKNAGKQWVQNKGNADLAFFNTQPNTPVMMQEKAKVQAQIDTAKKNVTAYKTGGLVDYTGPAWVDGTKSRPEAFLSADDTQMIRTLIDGWKYVAMQPTVTNVDGLLGRGSSNTIGQVNVTLNEAQFNTDEDYELVAQKVGEAFTKELAKTGFKTASFAF